MYMLYLCSIYEHLQFKNVERSERFYLQSGMDVKNVHLDALYGNFTTLPEPPLMPPLVMGRNKKFLYM